MRLASIDLQSHTLVSALNRSKRLQSPNKTRVLLTDIPLLQESQRIQIRAARITVEDVGVALIVDIGAGEELDGGSNDAGDEEHEEDEGEQHHDAREEFALRNVHDFNHDEDDGQGSDRDAVRHYPMREVLAHVFETQSSNHPLSMLF